jgi:alpha-maltose-1-phosphate synthase
MDCTSVAVMRVDLLTREYPPEVYGGAGVHVGELVRALRGELDVVVRCFGSARPEENVFPYLVPAELVNANPSLAALGVDLQMAQDVAGADLVHSHTWYANGAGRLAQLLYDIPHVVTAHSLEPLRPWKAEQLGGGYRISREIEESAFRTADAIIAVSTGMRRDILRTYPGLDESKVVVVHNGIDLERWRPAPDGDLSRALGIDPERPSVVFVGRITRQKGLPYLLQAAQSLPDDVQLVLCAGAPDTPELLAEVQALVSALQEKRPGVVWLDRLLGHEELITVLSGATMFVCPSIYEPLGIVNLEAMACGVPIVGTATGGIPEVVEDGITGRLVPIVQANDGSGTPTKPKDFVADLAAAMLDVLRDPVRARMMGQAGRARVEREFGWDRIAKRTREVYDSLS